MSSRYQNPNTGARGPMGNKYRRPPLPGQQQPGQDAPLPGAPPGGAQPGQDAPMPAPGGMGTDAPSPGIGGGAQKSMPLPGGAPTNDFAQAARMRPPTGQPGMPIGNRMAPGGGPPAGMRGPGGITRPGGPAIRGLATPSAQSYGSPTMQGQPLVPQAGAPGGAPGGAQASAQGAGLPSTGQPAAGQEQAAQANNFAQAMQAANPAGGPPETKPWAQKAPAPTLGAPVPGGGNASI